MPSRASVTVVDFTNVAVVAPTIAEAVAYRAPRCAGEPRRARAAQVAMTTPQVSNAGSHASEVAYGWPPSGSDMIRKRASPAEATAAEAQAAELTWTRSHTRPMTRENTSSEIRIDCTTDRRPWYSAMAWNTKLPMATPTPNSHSGLRSRYRASRKPFRLAGAPVLATCWVTTVREPVNAAASANRTLTMIGDPTVDRPPGYAYRTSQPNDDRVGRATHGGGRS